MKYIPIKEKASFVPIKLEAFFNDTHLSTGTGFFYAYKNDSYLITNWHIVSGRNPMNEQPLSKSGGIPNNLHLKIPHGKKVTDSQFVIRWKEITVNLYNDDEPIWLVHPVHHHKVDVAAIELSGNEETTFITANSPDLKLYNIRIYPSLDVYIIGYPLGMSGGASFPIWKRATIASEPEIDIDNLPKFFVDTATREGMSGSPVYAQETGFWIPEGSNNIKDSVFGKGRRLIGIYSGRIGAEDEFKAQLGVIWKISTIEEILEKKIKGKSSFFFNNTI
jgi:hypothetical protein